MVKIFKRVLFLAILGLIGFGIYTGISKLVDAIKAPKTATSVVQKEENSKTIENTGTKIVTGIVIKTGTSIVKTGTLVTTGKTSLVTTGSVSKATTTKEETGFFGRMWSTIKGWFTFGDSTPKTTISTGTNISSGKQMTGLVTTGEVISGATSSTGTSLDELIEDDSSTGTTITTKVPTKTPTKTTTITKTSTSKTTTVPKKPSTTTKVNTSTDSEKDPILDALF